MRFCSVTVGTPIRRTEGRAAAQAGRSSARAKRRTVRPAGVGVFEARVRGRCVSGQNTLMNDTNIASVLIMAKSAVKRRRRGPGSENRWLCQLRAGRTRAGPVDIGGGYSHRL